jgi:hypothetical protein
VGLSGQSCVDEPFFIFTTRVDDNPPIRVFLGKKKIKQRVIYIAQFATLVVADKTGLMTFLTKKLNFQLVCFT